MVKTNESEDSEHTTTKQDRRELLRTVAGTAVACGLGTTAAAAAGDTSQETLTQTRVTNSDPDVAAVRTTVERTQIGAKLDEDGFSLRPDQAAVYSMDAAADASADSTPAAVILPLESTDDQTAFTTDSLFGLLCAATTTDENGDRTVSTIFGIGIEQRPTMFSWFVDRQYGATLYYLEDSEPDAVRAQGAIEESVATKTIGVDEPATATTMAGQTAEEEEKSTACSICTLSSTLICNVLQQLGPVLCQLACRGNGLCNQLCPTLADIVGELLCENTEEFCELITACDSEDDSEDSGDDSEDSDGRLGEGN